MNTAPLHIGIVACSAEGAALCYRTLCAEGARRMGPHAHPEISLHTHSLADYVACLDRGDLDGVAALMLSSADKLARAGADFLICPDNTIHQALDRIVAHAPRPWLHIAAEVAAVASARGYRRIGILGTHWLVDSGVYPGKLGDRGLDYARPTQEDRQLLGRIIMDELVYGVFEPASVARLQGIVDRLKDDGCDAVVLGCTELPLVLNDNNCALPTLDSTRILARAALDRAINGRTP
ncbi:aspartate/glutamate racemase family protein [Achromobacter sp. NFACC18-2]|uniref:aspartate/glutamate racemase family protein n=1 Tax=Achromobacter sp. NFACC18-2 TaxID=1564112 RepID=UPI0008C74B32|nr:amino acid racemase [Achromobacter sp. NFACC18-2]SEK06898.1 aspartate racemase [Achromobacter sp. NFACC18-2]